jgi:XRE family transcriptional regulator of biofilm formation
MTVGERVKELRLKRGMTPVALAAAAGVTDSAILQLEQGLTKQPSFVNGLKIARALGVSPDELAGLATVSYIPQSEPQEGKAAEVRLDELEPQTAALRQELAATNRRLETALEAIEEIQAIQRQRGTQDEQA